MQRPPSLNVSSEGLAHSSQRGRELVGFSWSDVRTPTFQPDDSPERPTGWASQAQSRGRGELEGQVEALVGPGEEVRGDTGICPMQSVARVSKVHLG